MNIYLPYALSISLLGIYPGEWQHRFSKRLIQSTKNLSYIHSYTGILAVQRKATPLFPKRLHEPPRCHVEKKKQDVRIYTMWGMYYPNFYHHHWILEKAIREIFEMIDDLYLNWNVDYTSASICQNSSNCILKIHAL